MPNPAPLIAVALAGCLLVACSHGGDGPPKSRFGHIKDAPNGMQARRAGISAGDMFLFTGFDRDRDYKVTFDEVTEGTKAAFAEADTDSNALVSQAEYSAWTALALGDAYASPYFMHLDTDQDSALTLKELMDSVYDRARLYDKDKDNILTYAELRPLIMAPGMARQAGERRRGMGQRGRGRGRGRGRPPGF